MLPSEFQSFLLSILIWIQLAAFVAGLLFFKKVRSTHWSWFVAYLGIIFLLEAISRWGINETSELRPKYYEFFVIPFQFLFFYWLYAKESNRKKWIYWALAIVYLLSFIPHYFFNGINKVSFSLSYTVGNLMLVIMIAMEFINQMRSEKIVQYKSNIMFYTNLGVTLFYIGSLPFFSFYRLLAKDINAFSMYFTLFLCLNIIMYFLFTVAFIWGKPNTYQ